MARTENLCAVVINELKMPLPPLSAATKDAVSGNIYDGLRHIATLLPDFVDAFVEETKDCLAAMGDVPQDDDALLQWLSKHVAKFIRRAGVDQGDEDEDDDEEEDEVVVFYDSSDEDDGSDSDGSDGLADTTITQSPTKFTSQRYPMRIVKKEPREENESKPEVTPTDPEKEKEEDAADESDLSSVSSEEDPVEVHAKEVARQKAAQRRGSESDDSAASYSTAKSHRTPKKRKWEEDLNADTPSRRRLEAIRGALNGVNEQNNSLASPSATPPSRPTPLPSATPLARPALHTGATSLLKKLAVNAPSSSPNAAAGRSTFSRKLNQWDPDAPIPAPPREERYIEIVPKNSYQALLNRQGISYYVQWEVERHVQANDAITWSDFETSDFLRLVGSATNILPLVPSIVRAVHERKEELPITGVMRGDVYNVPTPATCAEMDLEEASIIAQDHRGLGNDDSTWSYGGRLAFCVSVQHCQGVTRPMRWRDSDMPSPEPSDDDNPFAPGSSSAQWPFTFSLCKVEPPSKSTRLARYFGSRRVLHMRFSKVPNNVRAKLFLMFRGRAFVLFGRVFRLLFVQPDGDSGVAVETNEHLPQNPPLQKPLMPSFVQLLDIYNSLEAKPRQPMAKWSSRLQLLLSDSIPGLHVHPDRIQVIRDIVCASAKDPEQPETVEILTDGCGLMSADLALRILQQPTFAHLTSCPTSIQMRIGGAKGLLSIMSPEQQALYPGKDIVLRYSMVKSYPTKSNQTDPSLFTLDILRVDYMRVGATLSSEPLIVLEHNGVPTELLLKMAASGLEEIRKIFLPAQHEGETQQDMFLRLIAGTYRLGGVGTERRRREVTARGQSAKVAGVISGMFSTDEESKDAEAPLAERLYELLMAGFKPSVDRAGCMYAASQLRLLVKVLSDKAVNNFKIAVEQSATAFIVPDSLGVLAPDEVFVSFSSDHPVDPDSKRRLNFLEGDCLLFRYPCKLPTDVRKFKAVVKPELFHLRDCIVLSANSELCTASPASFLGGGDYDGDTATIIWDQSLVAPFKNAPDAIASPPPDFQSNFVKQVTTVREFLDALGDCDPDTLITNLQHFLLGAMLDEHLAGIYSGLHDTSVYTRGCGHPDTMRLAHMFCSVLDARKSGLSVPSDIQRADRGMNPGEVAWRRQKKGKDDTQENIIYAPRPPNLGNFIMDTLFEAARAKQMEILASFPDPNRSSLSEDYSAFGNEFKYLVGRASMTDLPDVDTKFGAQVNTLDRHVKHCLQLWTHIHTKDDDTPVPDLYKSLWAGNPLPSCKASKRGNNPAQARKTAARVSDLIIVWREALRLEQVPLLAPPGHEHILAQLKIARAVSMSRGMVKVPFELDLATMCAMKARMDGPTSCIPTAIATRLKPTFSYSTL